MNEVNFVPKRIFIKREQRKLILSITILITMVGGLLLCLINIPLGMLNKAKDREAFSYKQYQRYNSEYISKYNIREQNFAKIGVVKKGIKHIGRTIQEISKVSSKDIDGLDLNYSPPYVILKGRSKNYNAIIQYCRRIMALAPNIKSELTDIEFVDASMEFNFKYRVSL